MRSYLDDIARLRTQLGLALPIVVMLSIVIQGASARGEPLLSAPYLSFELGYQAGRPILADVNRDGHADVLSTKGYPGEVVVLLGEGDGSFGPRLHFPSEQSPYRLAVADLNGDGDPDVVTRHHRKVAIYFGHGDGSFDPPVSHLAPAAHYEGSLAPGDVNGDGAADLLLAGMDTLTVLIGDGLGGFDRQSHWRLSTDLVEIADLDEDGAMDLIASGDGSIHLFYGRGGGDFEPATEIASCNGTSAIVVHDLNDDGKSDLALACWNIARVAVYLRAGDRQFEHLADFPCNASPLSLVARDFDRDGKVDVAVCNPPNNTVSVLKGRGDGSFAAPISFATARLPWVVMSDDFNGDGRLDLATAGDNEWAAQLAVILQNEDGTFGSKGNFETSSLAGGLIIRDVDGDGASDLVWIEFDGGPGFGNVVIQRGLGGGSFGEHVRLATGQYPGNIQIEDLNADGVLDLVVTNGDETVSVFLQQASGGWSPPVHYATGRDPRSVAAGDLNGDGARDLVVASIFGSTTVLFGFGDGTFSSPSDLEGRGNGVALVDLNGDRRLDLLLSADRTLVVGFGVGDGKFERGIAYETGVNPHKLRIGDLNGDGWLDAVTNSQEDDISVHLNRGDGTFHPRTELTVGRNPQSLALADFDGDGALDIATGCIEGRVVTVLRGDGGGGFGRRLDYGTDGRSLAIAAGDLNGDMHADIAVINTGSRMGRILYNRARRVPVLVEGLQAAWNGRAVSVRWSMAIDALPRLRTVSVERSEDAAGPYSTICAALSPAVQMSCDDASGEQHQSNWYRLALHFEDGTVIRTSPVTTIEEQVHGVRLAVRRLENGDHEFRYQVGSGQAHVLLELFDVRGRRIRSLENRRLQAAEYVHVWDGRAGDGRYVARGAYWARLEIAGRVSVRGFVFGR